MSITVGHLVVGGLGIAGSVAAFGGMRATTADNPATALAGLGAGGFSIAMGVMAPHGGLKTAMIAVGAGLMLGSGAGLRDALQGAVDQRMGTLTPSQ